MRHEAAPASDADQQRQLRRLCFDPPLEQQYRTGCEATARTSRITVLIVGIVMVGVTPLYDRTLLHAPAEFARLSHLLQFGIQIPALLIALLAALRPALQRWSAAAIVAASIVVAGSLMGQHLIGHRLGFNMPQGFAAMTVCALLLLGRVRFRAALPWATLTLMATSAAQLTMIGRTAIYDVVSSWMLFAIVAIAAYLLEHASRQSWQRGRLLEFLATRDGLTGLPNRRHFELELPRLIREAIRQRGNVALLLLDLDQFQTWNKRHGQLAGDQALRIIGEWLGGALRRPHDFCARIGGQQFAAVWANARAEDAVRLAGKLRDDLDALAAGRGLNQHVVLTASGGFAQIVAPATDDSPDRIAADLLRRADDALRAAKRGGRDRMVIDHPDEDPGNPQVPRADDTGRP
jgi:diguanylate cyclase (GGDEF)-like protein